MALVQKTTSRTTGQRVELFSFINHGAYFYGFDVDPTSKGFVPFPQALRLPIVKRLAPRRRHGPKRVTELSPFVSTFAVAASSEKM